MKKDKINDNLEGQAQALFKSWFVDFEPFQDGEFVDSELGRVPKGWNIGQLSDVGEIVGGGTPSKSKSEYYTMNGISWITPKDLSNNSVKFTAKGEIDITEIGFKNSSTKILPRGAILYSSRAPIGYISIARNDICTNQGFKSVVPKIAGTGFLYYFLKSNTQSIELQATGSTFKEASSSLMKSLKLAVPNVSVFNSFETLITPFFDKQEIKEFENKYLAKVRNTILPKLMSGELSVDKIEI